MSRLLLPSWRWYVRNSSASASWSGSPWEEHLSSILSTVNNPPRHHLEARIRMHTVPGPRLGWNRQGSHEKNSTEELWVYLRNHGSTSRRDSRAQKHRELPLRGKQLKTFESPRQRHAVVDAGHRTSYLSSSAIETSLDLPLVLLASIIARGGSNHAYTNSGKRARRSCLYRRTLSSHIYVTRREACADRRCIMGAARDA